MSPPYYAFVRFRDKAKSPFIVPSTDIRGLTPVHASDFDPKSTYQVYWQEGEGSFDGFYDAMILCMGASLSELKTNATEKGIKRMPPNFKVLQDEEKAASQLASQTKESSPSVLKRSDRIELGNLGRKRRIEAVLQELAGDPTGKKPEAKGSDLDLDSTTEADAIDIPDVKPVSDSLDSHPSHKESKCEAQNEGGKSSDNDDDEDDDSDSSSSSSECGSDSSEDQTAALSGQVDSLRVEVKSLKAACKISENSRLDLLSKLKDLEAERDRLAAENKKLCNRESRESSELSRLKDENKNLLTVKEQNERLLSLVRAAKSLLSKGLDHNVELPKSQEVKRSLDFDNYSWMQNDGFDYDQSFSKYSPHKSTSTPVKFNVDAEMDKGSSTAGKYVRTPVKTPDTSKTKKEKGLTSAEIDSIASKVRKDISGECPMSTNEAGKYVIGGGITISKEKWEKAIKPQSKNSMFITKLSHAVYGSEGLAKRTVGTPKDGSKGKIMATPQKVDAIVACLQGKILAEHPQFPNVREAAEAARTFLSRKMQDAARPPRKSNKSTADTEDKKEKKEKKEKKKKNKKEKKEKKSD